VEMMLENGIPTILSGLKAQSHILTPDVFFLGGLIHVIDSVLTIPISFPATITGAGLNDFVALLNAGGWLKADSIAVQIANSASDLTVFGPNDPRFGATFTGFDALSEEALREIFRYSAIQGTVVYSGLFKNNTQYKTLQGKSVTITEANGGFYVDQARITTRDYLCSNGVLQVINQPLNPDSSGSRPIIIPDAPPKSSKGGLSSAAEAGIGITLGVLLLGGGIVAALIMRNRKKRIGTVKLDDCSPPGPRGAARQVTRDTVELEVHGAPPQYELDNKTLDERSDTVQRHQIGSTVVELRQTPSPTPDHSRNKTSNTRSTRPNTNINRSRSGSQAVRESVASAGEHSLNLKAPAGGGLPPSPPNTGGGLRPPPVPAEIDGQERSRISIRISGEAPRHLGFQARY
jgi:Fasciclin domain